MMNEYHPHKCHDVIVAYARGITVQYRDKDTEQPWVDYTFNPSPNFNALQSEWRIKPEFVTRRVRMALFQNPGQDSKWVSIVDMTKPDVESLPGLVQWIGDEATYQEEIIPKV